MLAITEFRCYWIEETADKINHKKIFKFKILAFLKIKKSYLLAKMNKCPTARKVCSTIKLI